MGEVIGDVLPSALGVAISPVPIIAVILMLLAPRARAASVAYLIGWVVGVTTVVVIVTLVVDPVDSSEPDDPSTFASTNSIPISRQTARAIFVWASELASAGFHTSPTRFRPGKTLRAIANVSRTGCIVPKPARFGGC